MVIRQGAQGFPPAQGPRFRARGSIMSKSHVIAKAVSKSPVAASTSAPVVAVVTPVSAPAVQLVKLTGKPYRTAAKHNQEWWASIVGVSGPEQMASVQALAAAKVPAHFVGYCVRRGYLAVA